MLGASPVRLSRSAERDDGGRVAVGAPDFGASADRMLEEKAPTEKTPVLNASSRLEVLPESAAGRSELEVYVRPAERGRAED